MFRNFTIAGNEKELLTSEQAQTCISKVTPDQGVLKDSDIDAAKVAAMKAAELGNFLLYASYLPHNCR